MNDHLLMRSALFIKLVTLRDIAKFGIECLDGEL